MEVKSRNVKKRFNLKCQEIQNIQTLDWISRIDPDIVQYLLSHRQYLGDNWEHFIRDDEDFERHVNYIHYNPVKHGYVTKAGDWPFSTFHDFVRKGILDNNWGYDGDCGDEIAFGERS